MQMMTIPCDGPVIRKHIGGGQEVSRKALREAGSQNTSWSWPGEDKAMGKKTGAGGLRQRKQQVQRQRGSKESGGLRQPTSFAWLHRGSVSKRRSKAHTSAGDSKKSK